MNLRIAVGTAAAWFEVGRIDMVKEGLSGVL